MVLLNGEVSSELPPRIISETEILLCVAGAIDGLVPDSVDAIPVTPTISLGVGSVWAMDTYSWLRDDAQEKLEPTGNFNYEESVSIKELRDSSRVIAFVSRKKDIRDIADAYGLSVLSQWKGRRFGNTTADMTTFHIGHGRFPNHLSTKKLPNSNIYYGTIPVIFDDDYEINPGDEVVIDDIETVWGRKKKTAGKFAVAAALGITTTLVMTKLALRARKS